jgi:hypothetical protein
LTTSSRRRSYDLKFDRAEKHLIDLEGEVSRCCATHPYAVTQTREGKRQKAVWRFRYTSQPPDVIALIAADFIYNLRSGLDHLAATLVRTGDRDMFPIFFQGVWETGIEGENAQRSKERQRWNSLIRNMHPGAVAILKSAQPPDLGGNQRESTHSLAMLNRLSNKDRHTKLPIHVGRLAGPQINCRTPDGAWYRGALAANEALEDDAKLDIPHNATDVYIMGTPVVVIQMSSNHEGFKIPEAFRDISLRDMRRLADLLRPFDRGSP